MKIHLFAALPLVLSAGTQAAEPQSRAATNSLLIICQDGCRYTTNQVVFRKNVRAADSQMYLECELLTAWFTSKSTNAPKPMTAGQSTSSDTGDIDLIVGLGAGFE